MSLIWSVIYYTAYKIPADSEHKGGYTLDRAPIYHRSKILINAYWQFRVPVDLICMLLECGKTPENQEETHAGMGRKCKLHTQRHIWLTQGSNPGPFSCQATIYRLPLNTCKTS